VRRVLAQIGQINKQTNKWTIQQRGSMVGVSLGPRRQSQKQIEDTCSTFFKESFKLIAAWLKVGRKDKPHMNATLNTFHNLNEKV
jgi:hypothetical protein